MDPTRFDALTRIMAIRLPRRAVPLLGGLLAAVVPSLGTPERAAAACYPLGRRCGGGKQPDRPRCCLGLVCHRRRCRRKTCRSGANGQPCGDGRACCGGVCLDLRADPRNCGSCGRTCLAGERCLAGDCISTCLAGLTPCNGACVDILRDPANCGGCNFSCRAGETCCQGVCSALRDAANCGACGAACPPPGVCRLIGDRFRCDDSCIRVDGFCTPGGTPCCAGYPCALREPNADYTTCTHPCAESGQACVPDTVPGGPWCCDRALACLNGSCQPSD